MRRRQRTLIERTRFALLDFPVSLLPVPLARERRLDPLLFTWLQVEGMPLDLFDDVLLLYLSLESPEGAL